MTSWCCTYEIKSHQIIPFNESYLLYVNYTSLKRVSKHKILEANVGKFLSNPECMGDRSLSDHVSKIQKMKTFKKLIIAE